MALIRCMGNANIDLSTATFTDITSSVTASASQNFEVSSSADLSEYDMIAITAVFMANKTGDFAVGSGCTILSQSVGIASNIGTTGNNVAHKMVLIKDISASGFSLVNATAVTGTGGGDARAIGIKF